MVLYEAGERDHRSSL